MSEFESEAMAGKPAPTMVLTLFANGESISFPVTSAQRSRIVSLAAKKATAWIDECHFSLFGRTRVRWYFRASDFTMLDSGLVDVGCDPDDDAE